MNLLLSICIPTMNRPIWLLQALNSILVGNVLNKIEICISNNCSESDYSEVEKELELVSSLVKINYVRQSSRLSLDENMHEVVKMSQGEYIYLLGDDDYFLPDTIHSLLDFIKVEKPDLAIFNCVLVNLNNEVIGNHFDLPAKVYSDFDEAFLDLRYKGWFGSILVRSDHLTESDFEILYGTSHAYGCFWLSLFRRVNANIPVKIIIPTFPAVALRVAEKSYNHIEVYYRDIPFEAALYRRYVPIGPKRYLIFKVEKTLFAQTTSVRFLNSLYTLGANLHNINDYDSLLYRRLRWKILIISNPLFQSIVNISRYVKNHCFQWR